MLLCLSRHGGGLELSVDAAGEVAFELSGGFAGGFAACLALGDEGAGLGVAAAEGECDRVECPVELAIAGAVESPADGGAAAGGDRCDAGQAAEGGLVSQPAAV